MPSYESLTLPLSGMIWWTISLTLFYIHGADVSADITLGKNSDLVFPAPDLPLSWYASIS